MKDLRIIFISNANNAVDSDDVIKLLKSKFVDSDVCAVVGNNLTKQKVSELRQIIQECEGNYTHITFIIISAANILFLDSLWRGTKCFTFLLDESREKFGNIPLFVHFHDLFEVERLPDLFNSAFTDNICLTVESGKMLQNLFASFLENCEMETIEKSENDDSRNDDVLRDTIVAFATIKGYVAARVTNIGSLFISNLNKVLKIETAFNKDIFKILRHVQREMNPDRSKIPQLIDFVSYGFDDVVLLMPPIHYTASEQRVGALCIEVNYLFDESNSRRDGSILDGSGLISSFVREDVIIKCLNETNATTLISKIDDTIKEYGSYCYIFIMFLMSHGVVNMGKLYLRDSFGCKVAVDEILDLLKDSNSPCLKGKPKLVFVEACRGGNEFSQHKHTTSLEPTTSSSPTREIQYDSAIPEKHDRCEISCLFLIYSTLNGNALLQKETGESLFTHLLCNELNEESDQLKNRDFSEIIRNVSYKMKTKNLQKQFAEIRCIGVNRKFKIQNRDNGKVGKCFIIDNIGNESDGLEIDCTLLQSMFAELNYVVHVKSELSASEMKSNIKDQLKNVEMFDSFVLILLTNSAIVNTKKYEDVEVVFGFDRKCCYVEDIIDLFSNDECPQMEGKFKVIMIIGPRGTELCTNYDVCKLSNSSKLQYYMQCMKDLKRNIFKGHLIDSPLFIGIYSSPIYLTAYNDYLLKSEMKFFEKIYRLKERQPSHIIQSTGTIVKRVKQCQENYCVEAFAYPVDNMMFCHQSSNDFYIKYNMEEEISNVPLLEAEINISGPKYFDTENVKLKKNFVDTVKYYTVDLNDFAVMKFEIEKIIKILPSSIATLHIHFHGHGYYCTEKRENYVIGTNEEKIYFRQLFELFPKSSVIKCLYLDLCNFEWNHEGKTNEFYVMDTQQPSEMFFKRTDIFVHYVKPFSSGAVYCELFEIKNRFHKDGKEGIWVQFVTYPEVSHRFADYLSTKVRKTYPYHSESTKMDEYIDEHLGEINDDEIFILQLDLDAVKVDGSFMLEFDNKPFYLTTFFQTLMKNHPRLRYLPKMIFLNISVLDPCCGYIEYINLFATEKENSEITKNENKNYTTNSEMFIIWSTVSGFANLNGFHIGSGFSYLVREILRQSLSTKIGFTYLLSKESIYPIEINNVNAHKIIVFGNIESENAYDVKNGLCVIIENKCFPENMKPNYLSHITADNFEEAFECHNFEVRRDLHDAPAALMCDYLKKIAADSKLNRYTALVIIIISKSETILNANVIYGSDNQYISMNNLKMLFSDENCKALKGKLKLFIIDGPRGDSIPDYRNKDDVEIYSNVSQLFDKDISCAKNMPDNINFTIDTPMGHMNLGNTIIVGVSRERVQIKAMPQNNRHRFNIFKGETCIATLDDLSEYDFGYTYWEKTNASIVDSSVGKILFSRRRNNSKIPDRSKFKSAKCFCEI